MAKVKTWKFGEKWVGQRADGTKKIFSTRKEALKFTGKSKSKSSSKTSSKSSSGGRKMPKNENGNKKKNNFKVPVFTAGMVAPPVVKAAAQGYAKWQATKDPVQSARVAMNGFTSSYTGMSFDSNFNMKFEPRDLIVGWGPIAGFGLAKKAARFFGAKGKSIISLS